MEIIPDINQVLLNMLPFLVAVLGMYKIILSPMVDYLLERQAAIASGITEAKEIEEQIDDRMTDYQSRLDEARKDVTALRAERRASAQEAYEGVVGQAREASATKIEAALGEIASARDAAAAQLKGKSEEIADQVAGRVLGRSVSAGA